MPEKSIEVVLQAHTNRLMGIPGVVGTGQGEIDGERCISVFIVKASPDLLKKIPSKLEGYPVDVKETGKFKALGAD